MSNLMIDDESSRLKHFLWEELDDDFFMAVIFRSGRRYIVQRYFEQQLFDVKSSLIQTKWRRCLLEVISNSLAPIYITFNEVKLMHEIFSWHLNYSNNYIKLRENIDYVIDFEDLMESFNTILLDKNNITKSFFMQPVTTLDAACKNIEMWKNLQEKIIEDIPIQTTDKRVIQQKRRTRAPVLTSDKPSLPFEQSSSTGWLQLDSKIVPFIKKQCDRLLPVEYLLKEHLITSSDDFSLRSLYIPINLDDIQILSSLIHQTSSFNLILTTHSSLITLDHLIFRLKRLFFIRFLFSPTNNDFIDYHKIMSLHGGLLTSLNIKQQRIPFIYINKQKYIPQLNHSNLSSISTFCMANKYELEYLRLISLYDYLSSSDENNENLKDLSSISHLTLIPIDYYYEEKFLTILTLNDFHYHEYQRRSQQEKNLIYYEDNQSVASGWWQPPMSTKQKTPMSSHFKSQRPIIF